MKLDDKIMLLVNMHRAAIVLRTDYTPENFLKGLKSTILEEIETYEDKYGKGEGVVWLSDIRKLLGGKE